MRGTKIVGLLLAGGKSERMGTDKGALMLSSGETLGARAIRVLRVVCDDVVCAGHGRGVPDDVLRIADAGEGPLVALAAVLTSLAGARATCSFIALPIDMPGVDGQLLARLVDEAQRAAADPSLARDFRAACFVIEGRLEPLPLLLAAAAAVDLTAAVARGERRLARAVRGLAPALVALSSAESALMRNLNTREDLRAWSELP